MGEVLPSIRDEGCPDGIIIAHLRQVVLQRLWQSARRIRSVIITHKTARQIWAHGRHCMHDHGREGHQSNWPLVSCESVRNGLRERSIARGGVLILEFDHQRNTPGDTG